MTFELILAIPLDYKPTVLAISCGTLPHILGMHQVMSHSELLKGVCLEGPRSLATLIGQLLHYPQVSSFEIDSDSA